MHFPKKSLLFLLSLFLLASTTHGQDNPYDEIAISSPNAASLAKYADIPVNKHTGIPSISIPIYAAQEGPLKLPISLSYHASGLKVMEPASWIGAGWSLNAGGVITRSVRGAPDERLTSSVQNQEYGYFSNFGYPSYYYKSTGDQDWSAFANGYKDGEPDLYFFNFNGVTGKFYFREDRTPVLLPEQDLHIEPVYCDPACDESISSWVITTPDGTKYYFGKNGDPVEPIDFTRPYTQQNGIAYSNAISSWYLYKMESADQQFEINIDYESEQYSYYTVSMFPISPGSTEDEYKLIKNIVDGVRVSSISFTKGSVDFLEGADRQDLAGEEQSISEYPNDNANAAKVLSTIKVSNDANSLCKEFDFSHSYFNDTSTSLPGHLSNYSLSTDRKRLKLDSVQETSCDGSITIPPYSFSYYNDSIVPRRLTFALDHWGFYNGATNNDQLIPTYYVDDYTEVTGADRSPTWPDMDAGTLQKIERPTGGHTEFEYEPNDTHVNYTVLEDQPGTSLSFSAGYDGSEAPVSEELSANGSHPYKVELTNASCYYTYSTCKATLYIESYGTITADGGETVTEIVNLPSGSITFTLSKDNASTGSGAMVTVNEYASQNYSEDKTVGGLRIAKITHSDSVNENPDIVKTFDYTFDYNNQSTGVLYSRPVYASVLRNDLVKDYGSSGASSPNGCLSLNANYPYFISPSSIHPMKTTQGNHIGYNEVTVTENDGGFKTYRYYGSNTWDNVEDDISYRRVDTDDCSLDIPNYPAAPNEYEPYRGTLKFKGSYNASGLLQKRYQYFPTFEEETVGAPAFIATTYNNGTSRLLGTKYEIKTSKKTKMKVIESTFGDTGGDPVLMKTSITHFSSENHALPTKMTTIGDADSTETHIQYVSDIELPTCQSISYSADSDLISDNSSCLNSYYTDIQNCNGSESCEFQAWLDYESCRITARQNYLTSRQSYTSNYESCLQNAYSGADAALKPVLDLRYRHQVGSEIERSNWRNDEFLGSTYFDYRVFDGDRSLVYPKYVRKIFTDSPLSPTTFSPATGTNSSISKDGDYELERTLDFDAGNLTEIAISGGETISYIWENNYPIVKAVGVDYSTLISAYNAAGGNLTTLRGQSGVQSALLSTYTYRPLVGITTLSDQTETEASFAYDDLGRLLEVKNNASQTVTDYSYTYVGSGFSASNPNWIETVSYPGTGTNRYATEYIDGLGRGFQTHQRDGANDIISGVTFDGNGRKYKQYKSYTYDTNHSFDGSYDSHAQSVYGNSYPFIENIYQPSAMNRLSELIPEGGESASGKVSTGYDVRTWNSEEYFVTTTTDESGNVTETWTDVWGRKARTIADPGSIGAETQFGYDSFDRLSDVTAPNNVTTTYGYDARGRVDQKTSPDAGTMKSKYDKAGNLRFSQDANQAGSGRVTFQTYDYASRKTSEGTAPATFANLAGDSSYGFESDTTNLHGRWVYDGKPSTSTFPWSKFSSLINATTVSNTKGQLAARAWRFGGSGIAQTASVQGVGVTGTESYKAASSLQVSSTIVDPGASLTLASGGTITLKPGFHAKSGSAVNASIDPALATAATEGVSSVAGSNPWQMALYSYDSEGRVADKWIWTGNRREWDTHLAYEYNRLGDITKRTISVGSETLYQHYSYNQRGLLASVTVTTDGTADTESPEVSYSYTATGAIANIDYQGSKDASYAYTIRDWVESINDVSNPGGNFAADYDYADNGNISKAQFYNPAINLGSAHNRYHWNFSYDNLNRLTGADYGYGATGGSSYFDVTGLTYDDAGNITALQRDDETGALIDNLTYSYAGSNRLQSVADAVASTGESWDAEDASFGYDAAGNLTSQSGKLTGIAYDHRNLPTQFALATNDTLIANYNADGQRIFKELKGGAWQFYVMDGGQTMAVIDQGGLSHFNLIGNSTFGRWEPGGARRYYITDHLGSTRAVVDNNGTVLETFDYYPFGLLMPKRNTAGANTIEKFTGKERDEEGGLNLDYFGARYYDVAIARWHGVDPLAKKYPEWSPYNYTLGNPIKLIDPDGQMACPPEVCGGQTKDSYSKSVFEAIVNNVATEVKSVFNYAKVKATSISVDLGLTSKVSENLDTMSGSLNVTKEGDDISLDGSIMFLSGGAQIDENGADPALGLAGIGAINPETGSFDLNIPVHASGSSLNVGHNFETGDTKLGAGLGIGIKNILTLGVNAIFNFQENAKESREMRQNSAEKLERALIMDDEF